MNGSQAHLLKCSCRRESCPTRIGVELPRVGLGETPAEVGSGLFSESQHISVPTVLHYMSHLEIPLRDNIQSFFRVGGALDQRAGAKAG